MIPALLLLAAAAQATPVPSSGLFNAGELKLRCDSSAAADISYCYAYITGVYDTVRAYEQWLNLREFCTPAGVAQSELRKTFVDYMSQNPGYNAGEAASVVVVAFKQRYLCTVPGAAAPAARPAAPRSSKSKP